MQLHKDQERQMDEEAPDGGAGTLPYVGTVRIRESVVEEFLGHHVRIVALDDAESVPLPPGAVAFRFKDGRGEFRIIPEPDDA